VQADTAAKQKSPLCRGTHAKGVAATFRGEQQDEFISFASIELLWRVLTAKRWEILRAMTGQGALSIREVARRVGRDVKAVHGDITSLINAGVLARTGDRVIFPYDAVHGDFTLRRAA
jgi:predicted transcriptional regulator